MINFTAKALRRLALIMMALVLVCATAVAQSETTLTVQLKGITFDPAGGWRPVTLSAPIVVADANGQELGRVVAGQGEPLALTGVSEVVLTPEQAEVAQGYVVAGSTAAAITQGENNLATVFVYAKQGLFTVTDTRTDTGAPATGAEYTVLDASGAVCDSITIDETGMYRASALLPSGEYKLVQMRAADGTLPTTQPVSFTVTTYFGNDTDIAQVEVHSEPVPQLEASVGQIKTTSDGFTTGGDGSYNAQVAIQDICNGANNMPLGELAVSVSLDGLRDVDGNLLAADGLLSLAGVSIENAPDAMCSVQAYDAAHTPIGETLSLTQAQAVALPEGAAAVDVRYNGVFADDNELAQGFQAGMLLVYVQYASEGQAIANAESVQVTASCNVSSKHLGVDGMTAVLTPAKTTPAQLALTIPDGRQAVQMTADAQQTNVVVTAQGITGTAYIKLPEGARVQADALGAAQALHLENRDIVAVAASELQTGYSLPIANGGVTELSVWVRDPQGLAKTTRNPNGASLMADEYAADVLLDTLQGEQNGLYAVWNLMLNTPISQPAAQPYTAVAASGAITDATGVAAQPVGVLVGQAGQWYGAQTGANGTYTVLMPELPSDALTLRCALPSNSRALADDVQGMYQQTVNVPTELSIAYTPMAVVSGTVSLEDGTPVADAAVTLLQNGQGIAQAATDARGAFRFEQLVAGEYALAFSTQEGSGAAPLAGQDMQVDGNTATTAVFTLADSQEYSQAFMARGVATVNGSVTRDGANVAGVTVSLACADGSAVESVTDENGSFVFEGVACGETTMTIQPPEGTVVQTLNGVPVSVSGAYTTTFALGVGVHSTQEATLTSAAAIEGVAAGLGGGQTIAAVSATEALNTQTDDSGAFRFTSVLPGDYSIYVPLPDGSALAQGSSWSVSQQGDMVWLTVTAQAGGTLTLPDISFELMTSIEGCAYVDANGNMQREEGEQLMTGVPVALQREVDGAWQDVSDTLTDEYGQYSFEKLEAGTYRVASMTDAGGLFVASVGQSAQSVGNTGVMCSANMTVAEGDRNQADVGLQTPATLHFVAYLDANSDGASTEGERAVAGVTVDVVSGESVLATGTTDAVGELLLENIRPGSHTLRVTLPDGYAFGTKGAQSCVGDSNEAAALSDALLFSAAQATETGAGLRQAGSLGGKVFEDMNNDGIMAEDEPGVAGVTLHLEGERTRTSYTITTDETGIYRFTGLADDTYTLYADLPEGMLYARYSPTGGDLRSVFTGSTVRREFPVRGAAAVTNKNVGVVENGTIAGTAFVDLNYNGVYDEGEPGFEGVTLEAIRIIGAESRGKTVSAADGSFTLSGLRNGDYRLRAILPDDGSIFTIVPEGVEGQINLFAQRSTRRENSIQPIHIESGGQVQALVGVALGATVSGAVFEDADYNGQLNGSERLLSGLRVQLIDAVGNITAYTTTNAQGRYTLSGIMPGDYTLEFQRRSGYGFTRVRPNEETGNHVVLLEGEFGKTDVLSIVMGQDIQNINAGMLPASTVTGRLFHDTNDNGLWDEGETGMTTATVRLLSQDGEIDIVAQVQEDGTYFFDGVMPGPYTLSYQLPEHAEMARVAEGGNTVAADGRETVAPSFEVTMGVAYECPLAGGVTLGNFSGYVFHDINGDGVANEGEERMAGAQITLTPDRVTAYEETAVSAADGTFVVEGLRPAEYQLTMTLPNGYIFSRDLAADGIALDTLSQVTVRCPWSALTNRTEKAVGAVKPSSISGVLWLDENKDGTRGSGEMLMSDVRMELVDEQTSQVVKRVTSTDAGFVFENVRPGTYTVRFTMPSQSEMAVDATSTFALNGTTVQNTGVVVTEAQAVDGLTTGLISRTSVGGKLWLEEAGTSTSVAGVTVELFMGSDTTPLQTTVTGEDGAYRFDGLWPADYHLQVGLPNGMVFVEVDDPNYQSGVSVVTATGNESGTSDMFYLEMAQHRLSQNVIYIKPAKVGDQAWLDNNKNGLIDGGEPVITGVQISLLRDGQVKYQTTTDAAGYYLFDDVYPGTYTLQATAYPQLGITTPIAQLRMISSCLQTGDGTSAQSEPFAVESGTTNVDYNLGYVLLDGQEMPSEITNPPARDWSVANEKYANK